MKSTRLQLSNRWPAALSGLLLTAAFPTTGAAWLAWFALVPLLAAIRNTSPEKAAQLGFLAGGVHFLTLLYWVVYTMHTYGHLPWLVGGSILVLLAAYLGLYPAVFAWGVNRFCRTPLSCCVMAPVFWVALEYLRAVLLSGFPWELLGHSQYKTLQLIQISDIFGVYGVSLLLAGSNAALLMGGLLVSGRDWHGESVRPRLAAGSLFSIIFAVALVWSYGAWRIENIDAQVSTAPSARVALVQGNIDQNRKWDPAFQLATTTQYLDLSRSVAAEHPDLIVWPETALPFHFRSDARMTEIVTRGIRSVGTHFLIGSPSFIQKSERLEYYNSAYLIAPDGRPLGKYDKAHLVPFGEYVPFQRWLPFLGKIVAQVGDFRSGPRGATLAWGEHGLGVQICYEIIFSPLARAMARHRADLLVNITNDAWFGTTSAPFQHFSMTVFRAIETRRALVRAANTGISGFVDPAGRIVASTGLFQTRVITHTVPLLRASTVYLLAGDSFAGLCLALALAYVLWRTFGGQPTKPSTLRRK